MVVVGLESDDARVMRLALARLVTNPHPMHLGSCHPMFRWALLTLIHDSQVPLNPARDVVISEMLPRMRPYCPCEPMDSEVGVSPNLPEGKPKLPESPSRCGKGMSSVLSVLSSSGSMYGAPGKRRRRCRRIPKELVAGGALGWNHSLVRASGWLFLARRSCGAACRGCWSPLFPARGGIDRAVLGVG